VRFSENSHTHRGVVYRFLKPVAVSEIPLMLMRVLSRFLRNLHPTQGGNLNATISPTIVGPQEIKTQILSRLRRIIFRFQRSLYPTTVGSVTLWVVKDKRQGI